MIVSALGSFHGRTYGSLSATGQLSKHKGFEPLVPGFEHVAYDDLDALERACDGDRVAAVILEPIQGEAGVIEPSAGYLAGAREICDRHRILLVVDEVQTGLGRTGRWFAFQTSGIVPDVVTVAKALGNGMPIGACWARAEVAAAFDPGDHGTTFGGQPLAAAAASATLDVMQQIDAPALAAKAGGSLRSALARLDGVDSVRGQGLLIGVQLTSPIAGDVAGEALRRGLVVNACRPDTLRIAPAFALTDAEIQEAVGILAGVLASDKRRSRRSAVMVGKTQRQHRIGLLLERNAVSTQEQLVELLSTDGVDATQATVSRDLEELGAIKVRIAGGEAVYALPELPSKQVAPVGHLRRVLGDWVVELSWSHNIVVLRTPPGSAHVVGSALDRSGFAGIVGTVAGDDTVLVVAAEEVGGRELADRLREVAGFEEGL